MNDKINKAKLEKERRDIIKTLDVETLLVVVGYYKNG